MTCVAITLAHSTCRNQIQGFLVNTWHFITLFHCTNSTLSLSWKLSNILLPTFNSTNTDRTLCWTNCCCNFIFIYNCRKYLHTWHLPTRNANKKLQVLNLTTELSCFSWVQWKSSSGNLVSTWYFITLFHSLNSSLPCLWVGNFETFCLQIFYSTNKNRTLC